MLRKYQPIENKEEIIIIHDSCMTSSYKFDNTLVVFLKRGLSLEEKEKILQEIYNNV